MLEYMRQQLDNIMLLSVHANRRYYLGETIFWGKISSMQYSTYVLLVFPPTRITYIRSSKTFLIHGFNVDHVVFLRLCYGVKITKRKEMNGKYFPLSLIPYIVHFSFTSLHFIPSKHNNF